MFALRITFIFLTLLCFFAYAKEDIAIDSVSNNLLIAGPQNLFDLPNEILLLIMHEIIGGKYGDVDITVPRKRLHRKNKWLSREDRPPIFHCFQLQNFMLTSKKARDLVLASFEGYRTFYSGNTRSLERLPRLLNPLWFQFIRKLTLRMDMFTKRNDELVFPGVMNVLCKDMKHLQELILFSDISQEQLEIPYADHRDIKHSLRITRQQQEIRVITRLMAHVVVRHELLNRLIIPAASGSFFWKQSGEEVTRHFLIADAGQARSWASGDRVLDATGLCLKTWSELAVANLHDHVVSPPPLRPNEETPSSRVALKNGYYAPVFEEAYSLPRTSKCRNTEDNSVDYMIQRCRTLEQQAREEINEILDLYHEMCSIDVQAKRALSEIVWNPINESAEPSFCDPPYIEKKRGPGGARPTKQRKLQVDGANSKHIWARILGSFNKTYGLCEISSYQGGAGILLHIRLWIAGGSK